MGAFKFIDMEGFVEGKEYPTYKDVYERLGAESVFATYIGGEFKTGSHISPIGTKDRHASLGIFYSHRKGKYMFKEFRYGYVGDCIDMVRYIYSYPTNSRACMRIMHDFGIDDFRIDKDILGISTLVTPSSVTSTLVPPERKVEIRVTVREWKFHDMVYWGQYGITKKWLERGNIYPISHYYVNGFMRIADTYGYAYIEKKDGVVTYKIYQPYAERRKKWLNDNDASIWELWDLLPEKFPILIITKSRKDALSIISTIGIPSTALQAEGTKPKPHVMQELKNRFDRIIVFYDNDFDKDVNYGFNFAKTLSEEFNLEMILLPSEYGVKDYSDFIKQYGPERGRQIFKQLVNNQDS